MKKKMKLKTKKPYGQVSLRNPSTDCAPCVSEKQMKKQAVDEMQDLEQVIYFLCGHLHNYESNAIIGQLARDYFRIKELLEKK